MEKRVDILLLVCVVSQLNWTLSLTPCMSKPRYVSRYSDDGLEDRGITVRFPAKAGFRLSSPKCPNRLRSPPVVGIEWELGWAPEPVKGVVFPEVRRPGCGELTSYFLVEQKLRMLAACNIIPSSLVLCLYSNERTNELTN
jgi:hypothetical protein